MQNSFNVKSQCSRNRLALVNAFLALMLISCGGDNSRNNAPQAQKEEVSTKSSVGLTKVGVFIDKIGRDENVVKALKEGMQLALEGSAALFELKYSDVSQGDSPTAISLKTLVESDKSPAMIYWSVDDVSMVAPFLKQSKSVGIVSWDVSKKIIPLGAGIFGFGYSTELTFKQLAKYAGNVLKSYRFGVIRSSEPRFEIQSKTFIEETKSLGNTIVFDETANGESADFPALIKRAQKENCDTVFAVLPAPALAQFIKTAKALSFKGKILVGDTLFPSDLAALGQEAEGVHMVQAWNDDASLKALYSSKYGSSPDGITLGVIALGYDLVRCLQAVNAPFDAASISYSFLANACEGLTGKTQFTGERMAQRKKRVLSVKNGQTVPVD